MGIASECQGVAVGGDIAELVIGAAGSGTCLSSAILHDCLIGSAVGLIGTLLAACTGLVIGLFHVGSLAACACAFFCAAMYVLSYHALRGLPAPGHVRAPTDTRWPRA